MSEFGPGLAALFGLVEGLTEFLPISSTGHLILLAHWLGYREDIVVSIEICIQFGAVLAIVFYERKKIFSLLRKAHQEQSLLRSNLSQSKKTSSFKEFYLAHFRESVTTHRNLWFIIGLGIAFIPSAFLGLLAHDWIEQNLFSPRNVAISLIVGGIIILIVESFPKSIRYSELEQINLPAAIGVGIAQCMALIPGMSRSASTIVGGLVLGFDRKLATEFSFFLALPTMFAATGYKFIESFHLFSAQDVLTLCIGLFIAFLVAWLVINAFLIYVKRHTLCVFAYYRLILGTIILLLL